MSFRNKFDSFVINFFKPKENFPHLPEQNFKLGKTDLPKEIIGEILNRLLLLGDTKDLIRLSRTNKQFYALINSFIKKYIDAVLHGRIQDKEMFGAIVIRRLYSPFKTGSHFIVSKMPLWFTHLNTGPGFKREDADVQQRKFEKRCQLLGYAQHIAFIAVILHLSFKIYNLIFDADFRENFGLTSFLLTSLGVVGILLIPLILYLATGCLYTCAEVTQEQLEEKNKLFGDKLKEIDFVPKISR